MVELVFVAGFMNKKRKIVKALLSASAFLLIGMEVCVAQKAFESYTQSIDQTSLEFDMIAIPEGTFKRGSKKGNLDESPVHKVQVDPFWMGSHEVTWELFEMFVSKDFERRQRGGKVDSKIDAVTRPTKPYLDMSFGMGKGKHPAVGMTQYNAIQFCKWLYESTGVFYRLPTEAEWEYAARAGSKTEYYYGNDPEKLESYAWYKENSDAKTHEVGQKEPNSWGLFDMYGNVAEWTIDQYAADYYRQLGRRKVKNPIHVATELYPHTLKGGSFMDSAFDLRSSSRKPSEPSWKQLDPQVPKSNWWSPEAPFVGFRLVRPLKVPDEATIMAYYNQEPIADF